MGLVTFPNRCISETVLEARRGASQEIGGCGRSLSSDWQLRLRYSKVEVVCRGGGEERHCALNLKKKNVSIFVFVRGTRDNVSYAFFLQENKNPVEKNSGRVMLGEGRRDKI